MRDTNFGQVLAVGLGGIFVELFKDASLRVCSPVGRAEVRAMIDELQGRGAAPGRARGSKPADMDALVQTIVGVAQLAQALGDDLESLEINPLRVDGNQIEALDAVVTLAGQRTEKSSCSITKKGLFRGYHHREARPGSNAR